ncbi:MAG: VOC family protein [bacterium]|nr:VOC family protein [bacterium]
MQKITGLGGCFFRADNPEKLSKWYETNFGINSGAAGAMWQQEAGITVFSAFPKDSDYFPKTQQVMFNFRVDDLDAMLLQLKENGVKIDEKRQNESYGKFAWVYDPEENKIELWQPINPK